MNDEFIKRHQRRIANIAVGPSTARKMGPPGTVGAAQTFLRDLDLKRFKGGDRSSFEVILDIVTDELKASLPVGGQYWGSSRKFLNIFLRDVLYSYYLSDIYDFSRLAPWLEIPLDRHVAIGLEGRLIGLEALPKWNTVIRLSQNDSGIFQGFAEKVAIREGTQRIHLDLIFWRPEKEI